jgi:hypothetical protein
MQPIMLQGTSSTRRLIAWPRSRSTLRLGLKRLDDRLGRKVIVLLSDSVDVERVLAMQAVRTAEPGGVLLALPPASGGR